jgi:hypothetical protein
VSRAIAWWWVLVPLVAAIELGRHVQIEADVPTAAQWRDAARTVARDFRDGDLVVVAPEWAAQVARPYLGERLQRLEDVARPDTSRYARLWVLSIRGARAPEEARAEPDGSWLHGAVTVRRLRLPAPARVHFDFVRQLHTARVSKVKGRQITECAWMRTSQGIAGGRFRCDPRVEWNRVDVQVLDDLDRRPHLGIWAHPVRDATIAIEFEDVPMGERIAGHTGLRYEAAKRMRQGPVRLRVLVDDRAHGPFVERDRDSWKAFSVDTRALAGRRARVRFEVTAPDPGMRHFYFEADTRTGGPR